MDPLRFDILRLIKMNPKWHWKPNEKQVSQDSSSSLSLVPLLFDEKERPNVKNILNNVDWRYCWVGWKL